MARGGYAHRAILLVALLLIGGPIQIGLSTQYDGTITQQLLGDEPHYTLHQLARPKRFHWMAQQ